jgi:hypothetical protein
VLEQAVAVGLVEVLGRRRRAVAGPQRRVGPEDRVEQPAQIGILDRRQQLAQVGLHLPGRARRSVDEVGEVERSGLGGADGAQLQLGAVAPADLQAAAHAHGRTDRGDLGDRRDLVPDVGGQAPGAVAEHEAQVLAAIALGTHLGRPHDEDGLDLGAPLQLSHEHGGQGGKRRGRTAETGV